MKSKSTKVPLDDGVRFVELPPPNQTEVVRLLEVVRHRVLRLLESRSALDREGLKRLCRYGARGALALERFEEAEDGRIAYRMKRPMPDGTTHVLFTGLELLRRLASLVPPPRTNLTRFHGVFAPGATLRPFLLPTGGGAGQGRSSSGRSGSRQYVQQAAARPEAGLGRVAPRDVRGGCLLLPTPRGQAASAGPPHAGRRPPAPSPPPSAA